MGALSLPSELSIFFNLIPIYLLKIKSVHFSHPLYPKHFFLSNKTMWVLLTKTAFS